MAEAVRQAQEPPSIRQQPVSPVIITMETRAVRSRHRQQDELHQLKLGVVKAPHVQPATNYGLIRTWMQPRGQFSNLSSPLLPSHQLNRYRISAPESKCESDPHSANTCNRALDQHCCVLLPTPYRCCLAVRKLEMGASYTE